MSRLRAPWTIAVAALAILATLCLSHSPCAAWPGLSWLVHADLLHLVTDIVPWLLVGLWLEPHAGSVRWCVWSVMAVAMTAVLHPSLYPAHAAVYGLSAVNCTVAFVALVSWPGASLPRSDPRRWIVLIALSGILIDEQLRGVSAWRSAAQDLGAALQFVRLDRVSTTPLLHAAAAIMGILLGLAPALGMPRQRPTPQAAAGGAPAAASR